MKNKIPLADKIKQEFKEAEHKHIEFLRERVLEDVRQAIKDVLEEIKDASCGDDYYDNCNFKTFEEIIKARMGKELVE